jgi:hypothetical protein
MRQSGPAKRSRGLRLPSKPAATASGWRAGSRRAGRGARDASIECRGITGTSPGKDRSAGHRIAQSRVPGVAAWGTGPLQHGAGANDCRRGRQAAEPRARMPGGGTHADCEPDKGHPRPAGHSQLQTNPARACPREGGGPPNVWQPCTPRKACRCHQTPWPSCSATWRGWALLSARSERSRTLVRNDWSSSLRPAPRHGSAAGPNRRCWCRDG